MEKLNLINLQTDFIHFLDQQGKSFNTIKNYKTDLNIYNQFLVSKGRELFINEVTLKETQEYSHFLEKKYNSPNSIRRRVQALRIFFDFLIANDHYHENPIKKILVSPKVVDLPKPTPFHLVNNIDESLKFEIENTKGKKKGHEKLLLLRNRVLFHLIYGAGLKVSDLERISTKHISQKDIDQDGRIIIAPEKKEPFTIKLPKSFFPILNEYLELLDQRCAEDKIQFDDLLFNGNPFKISSGGLSARGVEIIFKEISKRHEQPITAKNLRQACIFKWLIQDTPQARVKEWMSVQPQYSLTPYIKLLNDKPEDYPYLEL